MTKWQDFFDLFRRRNDPDRMQKPGPIMFCFVNRYLEPMDAIRYKIVYDGKTLSGVTTEESHTAEVIPSSISPVIVYAWSRVKKDFKKIDEVRPALGKCLLVYERMKTYKHPSKTEKHPDNRLPQPTPKKAPPVHQDKIDKAKSGNPQGVEAVDGKNSQQEPEHQTNRAVTEKITTDQLKKIFPGADNSFLENVASELNTDLARYKLDTPLRRAHFFAQVRQEAGPRFSPKQENLNYKPNVLIQKFSYYSAHRSEADEDGRLEKHEIIEKTVNGKTKKFKNKIIIHPARQESIANKAYGGRGGNGSAASGDGWRFRGRGIFQLTLRNNYTAFNNDYPSFWNDDKVDFLESPDKVCEFPYFIRSAVWYWLKNKVYTKADSGASDNAVNAVTGLINGSAMDAAEERRDNFHNLTYPAFK